MEISLGSQRVNVMTQHGYCAVRLYGCNSTVECTRGIFREKSDKLTAAVANANGSQTEGMNRGVNETAASVREATLAFSGTGGRLARLPRHSSSLPPGGKTLTPRQHVAA